MIMPIDVGFYALFLFRIFRLNVPHHLLPYLADELDHRFGWRQVGRREAAGLKESFKLF
jgi:hypothetical protein